MADPLVAPTVLKDKQKSSDKLQQMMGLKLQQKALEGRLHPWMQDSRKEEITKLQQEEEGKKEGKRTGILKKPGSSEGPATGA